MSGWVGGKTNVLKKAILYFLMKLSILYELKHSMSSLTTKHKLALTAAGSYIATITGHHYYTKVLDLPMSIREASIQKQRYE